MAVLMYSSIVLSRYVFAFLPIERGLALARRLHILGSYWGFLMMSLHLAVEVSGTEVSNEWLEAVDDTSYGCLK